MQMFIALQLWKPPEITKRANNRMIKEMFTYSWQNCIGH